MRESELGYPKLETHHPAAVTELDSIGVQEFLTVSFTTRKDAQSRTRVEQVFVVP